MAVSIDDIREGVREAFAESDEYRAYCETLDDLTARIRRLADEAQIAAGMRPRREFRLILGGGDDG